MSAPHLVAFPSPVYRTILHFVPPAVVRLMVERRVVLSLNTAEPDPAQHESAFEQWLVERWLKDIRSQAFTESAQGQHLIAEWERGR